MWRQEDDGGGMAAAGRVRRGEGLEGGRQPLSHHLQSAGGPREEGRKLTGRGLALRTHLKPRHKLWLNWDGAFLMGPRYLRFLEAVERTGTIRAAGDAAGWSYRTCLNRIRAMEHVLGAKVLTTTRGGRRGGGGARLTVDARRLKRLFARWRRTALRSSDAAFQKAFG